MFGELIITPAPTTAQPEPPLTLDAISPVAMAGVGTGWLLLIIVLTAAQLRSRIAAGAGSRRHANTKDRS
jgi:hypothetical protein